MLSSLNAIARALLIPLILLLATHLALPYVRAVAPAYQPLLRALPYVATLLPLVIAALLNQSRAFSVAVLLMLGYAGLRLVLSMAGDAPFPAAVIYTACCILMPFNIALYALIPERGLLNRYGMLQLGLILLQLALVYWIIVAEQVDLLFAINHAFLPLRPSGLQLSDAALLTLLLSLSWQSWRLWREPSALGAGLLTVSVAVAVACDRAGVHALPETYFSAAALILTISLVLQVHQIAYRDELTDLPARRALNERLGGLGRRYSVAMLDVDHFKKFNDTYGHDVGDQVLKMVASQLRRVGGGGQPYRYGGEEFTILFPGKTPEQTLAHLEAVRQAIAAYPLRLRDKDRPANSKEGRDRRGRSDARPAVHVTISIGVAGRDEQRRDSQAVLKAADEALYRAKQGGRNRLEY